MAPVTATVIIQQMETAATLSFELLRRKQEKEDYEKEKLRQIDWLRNKDPHTSPMSTPVTVELAETDLKHRLKEFDTTINILQRQITFLADKYIPIKPCERSSEIDIINKFLAPNCTVKLRGNRIGTITRSVSPGRVYIDLADGTHIVHTGPHLLRRLEFIPAKRVGYIRDA